MGVYKGVVTDVTKTSLHIELVGANPTTVPITEATKHIGQFESVWVATYQDRVSEIVPVASCVPTNEDEVRCPEDIVLPMEIWDLEETCYIGDEAGQFFPASRSEEGEERFLALFE